MSDIKIYNGSDINTEFAQTNFAQSATVSRRNKTRRAGKIGNLVSFFALALMLICVSLTATAAAAPPPNPNMEIGIVTGGIYSRLSAPQGINQPLLDNADQIFAEFRQLGAKWIRIEANWKGNFDGQYRFIADKAHEHGLKVVVVLNAGTQGLYCQPVNRPPGARDPWLNNYVAELNRLANDVFVNRGLMRSQADAYEITNEPNQINNPAYPNVDNSGCGLGNYNFRMDGDTYAWLLRFVWNWKTSAQRPEQIIAGAPVSTYYNAPTEPWWTQMFNSGAFAPNQGARPFDYFGVHPYNDWTQPATWETETQQMLVGLAARLDQVTRTSGTRLFATEFGDRTATRMEQAVRAFRNSGVVNAALWYDYRDDEPNGFGLRSGWNGTSHPVKYDMWSKFKSLAGGTGSNDSEYYWYTPPVNRTPYGVLDYANASSIGGWVYDPDTVNSLNVYVYIDGGYVGTTPANTGRVDLITAGVAPNAAHGFNFPVPSYLPGGWHSVTVISENYRGGNTQFAQTAQFYK
jgi:hypothetical protein